MWQKHIQPSELDKMDYWEFEEFIKLMNDRNKEENDRQKKQNEEQETYQNKMTPKMPDFNSFKPGNFNMPRM